jgi:cell division initiation protein
LVPLEVEGESLGLHRFGTEQAHEKVLDAMNANVEEQSPSPAHGGNEELLRQHQALLEKHEQLMRERTGLLDDAKRLEGELARYRDHAQRTSKIFIYATNYAESIRESARRDAEVTLRKARARAEKMLGDLESERKRAERELLRLQALTTETRKRLSAFTTSALQVLNAEVEEARGDASTPPGDDMQGTLETKLTSTTRPAPEAVAEAETRER